MKMPDGHGYDAPPSPLEVTAPPAATIGGLMYPVSVPSEASIVSGSTQPQAENAKANGTNTGTPKGRTLTVSLHISARDVPEPDNRSHANYAVVYYARDVPHRSAARSTRLTNHSSAISSDTVTSIPASEPPPPLSNLIDHQEGFPEAAANHSAAALPAMTAEMNRKTQSALGIEGHYPTTSLPSSVTRPQTLQHQDLRLPSQQQTQQHLRNHQSPSSPSHKNNNDKNNTSITLRGKSSSSRIFSLSRNSSRKTQADRKTEALGPPRGRAYSGNPTAVGGAGSATMGKSNTLKSSRRHPLTRDSPGVNTQRRQSTPIPSDQVFSNFPPPTFGKARDSNASTAQQKSKAATPSPNILTPFIRMIPQSRSLHRSPERVLKELVPSYETKLTNTSGIPYTRSAWTEIGATEVARKHGRDVEFARAFTISFPTRKGERIRVRVAVFDATSPNPNRRRLIATSDFALASAVSADGSRLVVPLRFHPIKDNKRDHRLKKKIPHGSLIVVAQRTDPDHLAPFRLDVECNRIIRATALSTTSVRAAFYTLHAILDADPESDSWTLIHRSTTVQMIHSKRDGGSLEYNYFSGVRLRTQRTDAPDSKYINHVNDGDSGGDNDVANDDNGHVGGGDEFGGRRNSNSEEADDGGIFGMLGKALGVRKKIKFFSMPGADLKLMDPSTRLKLSLWEDKGMTAGYDLIADTHFSIADLKKWPLGQSSAIKVHANTVGKSVLKFVECSPDPRYFCLSLMMQNII